MDDIARGLSESDQIRFEAARLVGELMGVVRVGYAEDAGDNIHVDITRSYAPGAPGLEGRYRYRLVLPAGGVPVNGFWSLSLYQQEPERMASIVLIGNLASLLFVPLGLAFALR